MVESRSLERERQNRQKAALGRSIVVLNIPKVEEAKYEKLLKFLSPRLEVGELGDKGIAIQKDENGRTTGIAFVEYRKPETAMRASKLLDGFRLDASHTLSVILLAEAEKIMNTTETFDESSLVEKEYELDAEAQRSLPEWLDDKRSREQFAVVQENNAVEVFWFDSVVGSERILAKEYWTDSKAMWSTRGNYLATFHDKGIAVWGGPEFKKLKRFPHENVSYAQFSKQENYLVTWSGVEISPGEESLPSDDYVDDRYVVVWEVATGRPLRWFPVYKRTEPTAEEGKELPAVWPIFKWSPDDTYFARLSENVISVYTTPSMGLLGKKKIAIPGVQAFEWSPTDPIIAYWTPEMGDSPARVCLLEIPSRVELRQKGLYSVINVQLKWKEDGNFLSCRVIRFGKNRKHQYTNFEIFHMRDKNYPIDILEFKEKEKVSAFEWEPKGNRFGVIHGEEANYADVSFYSMDSTSTGKLKHIFTVPKKQFKAILWSPLGTVALLARVGHPSEATNGTYEWYNVTEHELIGLAEHYSATHLEWDASGRFVCSYTTYESWEADNGYNIYNISGRMTATVNMNKMYQFLWRPRPQLYLTAEQEKNVRKNIKKYREEFKREDDELKESMRSGKAAERRDMRLKWAEYLGTKADLIKAIEDKLAEFSIGKEDDYIEIEEFEEEFIDIKEEVDRTRKMLNSDDERD